VAIKLAPSIDPVVLKAQHDPHLPCFHIMHKVCHYSKKTDELSLHITN